MDIPPKIRIPICIEQGSIYNFLHEPQGKGRESKNRYFLILNKEPKTDIILLMVTPTSKADKKKSRFARLNIDEKTMVIVKPSDYSLFTKETIFDCNEVMSDISIEKLIKKIEEGGCMNYSKMPKEIMNKIIKGVKLSRMVSDDIKKML